MEEDFVDPCTDDRQIPHEHLVDICKYRQHKLCCRYICFHRKKKEYYCVRNIMEIKMNLDTDVANMTAQGDNCPGLGVSC